MYIQKVLFPQGVHVEHFKQKIIVCVDVIVVHVYREHQRALYYVLAYFDHLFSLQTHARELQMVYDLRFTQKLTEVVHKVTMLGSLFVLLEYVGLVVAQIDSSQ